MKTITRIDGTNKFLVEMSQEEHDMFKLLQQAVEGLTTWDIMCLRNERAPIDSDFKNVFSTIHAWAIGRFNINQLQTYLDNMKKVM